MQPKTLVRFRGMIQDMLGNEFYAGAYKVSIYEYFHLMVFSRKEFVNNCFFFYVLFRMIQHGEQTSTVMYHSFPRVLLLKCKFGSVAYYTVFQYVLSHADHCFFCCCCAVIDV